MRRNRRKQYVVCVRSEGYLISEGELVPGASLELRKIYERIPDPDAESHGLIRVIDEDGDSALYPADFFLPVELSKDVEQALVELS
jgi:hypothetical protein